MTLWRRLFGRSRLDRELDAELRDHLERQVADYTRAGLGEAESRRKAAARFGGFEQAKDYCRDQRSTRWLEDLVTDVRYGVRMLAHSRTFTIVAVLSLALGIGANTAIFTLVNSLLMQSLPVHEPGRLVRLGRGDWTNPIWEEVRSRQPALFGNAAAWAEESFDLASGGQADPANGLLVSGRFFQTLGVVPALGQPIGPANDRRTDGAAQSVAVVSHGFWQRRFGGAPDVIGRSVSVNRVPFTIVGVTPPSFLGPRIGRSYDVAIPLAAADRIAGEPRSRLDGRSFWWLEILVRLKDGQTAEGATAALRAVQPQIREATLPTGWPEHHLRQYLREGLTLEPAAQGPGELRTRYQRPLMTIMVVVALVLLIACANIANLMLARANARRHELAMRLALGASGSRLTRQLLTESLLLSGLGALIGLSFARWGSQALVGQLSTTNTIIALDLTPDWRVLTFTTGLTVMTALLFGLVPALRARRLAPIEALKEQGRGLAGAGRRFLGSPLVVVQIALSLVLVVGAGLFMRSFAKLDTLDLGFDRDPVLLVHVNVQRSAVPPEQWGALFERLRDAAAAVPGVANAAVSPITPVSGMGWNDAFEFPDQPGLAERDRMVFMNAVTPGWFGTYGTRLLGGRDFTADDRVGSPKVAIANQAFVDKFMKGHSPLGRGAQPNQRPGHPRPAFEIVGLVENVAYRSVREPAPPTIFVPMAQLDADQVWPLSSISVRAAAGSPTLLTRSLAAALTDVDPDVSLRFQPLADQVNANLVRERVLALLSAFFGALALLLAGVGLYGVTSYAVSLRRTEIGVRMALGADAGRVLRLVLGRVVVLLALGLVIGTGISVWASRFVAELLFGLEPRDPTTLVVAVLVMVAAGTLAAWLPASRAARIDPVEVLREG